MGNINDYALPQMRSLPGIPNTASDQDCLELLEQAVYDLRRAMTVTVSDTSYTLSPAPEATSALWNVLALRARYLYLQKDYNVFLRSLQGASSFADENTRFSRNETIRARRLEVEDAKKEYVIAKMKYSMEDEPQFAEMEEREEDAADFLRLLNS